MIKTTYYPIFGLFVFMIFLIAFVSTCFENIGNEIETKKKFKFVAGGSLQLFALFFVITQLITTSLESKVFDYKLKEDLELYIATKHNKNNIDKDIDGKEIASSSINKVSFEKKLYKKGDQVQIKTIETKRGTFEKIQEEQSVINVYLVDGSELYQIPPDDVVSQGIDNKIKLIYDDMETNGFDIIDDDLIKKGTKKVVVDDSIVVLRFIKGASDKVLSIICQEYSTL